MFTSRQKHIIGSTLASDHCVVKERCQLRNAVLLSTLEVPILLDSAIEGDRRHRVSNTELNR